MSSQDGKEKDMAAEPEDRNESGIQDEGFRAGGRRRTTPSDDPSSSNVVWEGGRSDGAWYNLFFFLSAMGATAACVCFSLVFGNLDPAASSVNAGREPTPPGCAHAYVAGDEMRHPEWLPREYSAKGKTTARWSIDPACVRRFWSDAGDEAEQRRAEFTSGFDAVRRLFLPWGGIAAATAALFVFLAKRARRPRIVRILRDGSVEAGAPTAAGGGPIDAGAPPPLAPGSDWMPGPASEGRTPEAGSHRFEILKFDPEDASGKIRLSISGKATEIFSAKSIDKAISGLLLSGWEPSPSSRIDGAARMLACATDELRKKGHPFDADGARRCVAVPDWIFKNALRTGSIPFALGGAAWISSFLSETASGIFGTLAVVALFIVPFDILAKRDKNRFLAVENRDLLLVLQAGGRLAWRRNGTDAEARTDDTG